MCVLIQRYLNVNFEISFDIILCKSFIYKVDPAGFEPTTPDLQGRCSTGLSYRPNCEYKKLELSQKNDNDFFLKI